MTITKSRSGSQSRCQSRAAGLAASGKMALAAAVALSCATPARPAHAGGGLVSARGPYEVEVLLDGTTAPRFSHQGESYVMGQVGRRYTLRVWNRTARRVEAVVSVDGRDVIDGKPGDYRHKRGYLIGAWGFVDIDGWRLSEHQAAAFRFTSVADSYAARMGSARNVGVIGVAVFPERMRRQPIAPRYPEPYHSRAPATDAERVDDHARAESAGAPPSAAGRPSAAPAEAPAKTASPGRAGGALADSDAPRSKSARPERRPGLGTEFGESVSSSVQEVYFLRADATNPEMVLGLRYNDRRGLLALGIDVDGHHRHHDTWLRQSAQPFPVSGRFAAPPVGWRR